MKLTVVLLAALAAVAVAKPGSLGLHNAKSYLSTLDNYYKRMAHQTYHVPNAKRDDGSVVDDVDDGAAIMDELEEWEAETGLDETQMSAADILALFSKKEAEKRQKSHKKPHVIYFLIDDLGHNDVSWHNSEVLTPYIDSLTAEGVILEQAYAQSACSPSRGSLMTGKYAHNIGMQHDVIQWTSPECAPRDIDFLPAKLKTNGYSTHMLGKWHLGFCNEDCTPNARGFDSFFGFYQGYIDHYNHLTGEHGKEGYDWRDDYDAREDLDGQYAGTLLLDRAVEIINDYDTSSDHPMFMYFAHSGVHTPTQAPDEYVALYPNLDEHRATYLGQMSQVDDTIKAVVEALKSKGMYDESVIIMQSDNGGEFNAGENYPLRGSKCSVYEAGVRTPAFFHSPLGTAKGIKHDGLFHISDWHATILALSGMDASGLDGVDQSDMLLNGGDSARDTIVHQLDTTFPPLFGLFTARRNNMKAIFGFPGLFDGWERDDNYPMGLTNVLQIVDQVGFKRSSGLSDMSKRSDYDFDWPAIIGYVSQTMGSVQVYDIDADPNERTNIAASNGDFVNEMLSLFTDSMATERMPDLDAQVASAAGEAANFGGVWTPGWC